MSITKLRLWGKVAFSRDSRGFDAADKLETEARALGMNVTRGGDATSLYIIEDRADYEARVTAELGRF